MPPRRSTTKSATPSRLRSRSQSKGRSSASPRASAKLAPRTSSSPRRASSDARASTTLSASQASLHHEIRQVEAILANRRDKNGVPPPTRVGPTKRQRDTWGFWVGVIVMEVVVVVWCCWAYDVFAKCISATK